MALLFSAVSASALAQQPNEKPPAEPVSQACIAEAERRFVKASAFHDGTHKAGPPMASAAERARIEAEGELLRRLDGQSTLTPRSSYALVLLPGPAVAASAPPCPLHRMYVRFIQGGFHPQPPVYYGPLRAGDEASVR